MKDEQIEKIRSAVESAGHIPVKKKAELLRLVSKLKPVIAKVSQTHQERTGNVARLIEASAHEATKKNPGALKKLLHELEQSVEKFEASHPELVEWVTEYSMVLSGFGI